MTYSSAQALKDAPAGQTPSTPDADQPRHEGQGQDRDPRPRREAADRPKTAFILTLASDPLPGIIAAVSTAIAVECGFCDSSHLSRMFRRRFGGTPHAIRTAPPAEPPRGGPAAAAPAPDPEQA